MIRPEDVCKEVWNLGVLTKEATYDRGDAGWYAVNSVNPGDCVPSYRLPGGGVLSEYLTDLPEAIDQSISNIQLRKAECDRRIEKLKKAKDLLPTKNSNHE